MKFRNKIKFRYGIPAYTGQFRALLLCKRKNQLPPCRVVRAKLMERSASQISQLSMVHCSVHKSSPPIPIRSQINPIHTHQSFLMSILILSFHPPLGLQVLQLQLFINFSPSPRATCPLPSHHALLLRTSQYIFVKNTNYVYIWT
jgi:hypothetical protein